MTYKFRAKLAEGQRHEAYLDGLFADRFDIRPVGMQQERRGIDRVFTDRRSGARYTIQYKADSTAARTGNAFVETISVSTTGAPGWAVRCAADYIFYYVVGVGPIYVLRPADIRAHLDAWRARCEERRIPNRGYHTVGLLVPLAEFERAAVKVVNV